MIESIDAAGRRATSSAASPQITLLSHEGWCGKRRFMWRMLVYAQQPGIAPTRDGLTIRVTLMQSGQLSASSHLVYDSNPQQGQSLLDGASGQVAQQQAAATQLLRLRS